MPARPARRGDGVGPVGGGRRGMTRGLVVAGGGLSIWEHSKCSSKRIRRAWTAQNTGRQYAKCRGLVTQWAIWGVTISVDSRYQEGTAGRDVYEA